MFSGRLLFKCFDVFPHFSINHSSGTRSDDGSLGSSSGNESELYIPCSDRIYDVILITKANCQIPYCLFSNKFNLG